MDEIRAIIGPIAQKHFDKTDAERRAIQERIDAENAAKRAEEDARKAAEGGAANKPEDEDMADAKPDVEA
jgi:heat shock 70kDa protein 4